MKKFMTHLLCILFLAGAVLAVFWFNSSSASRTTVHTGDEPDTGYVDDPATGVGDTVGEEITTKEPITNEPITPPDVPVVDPTDPEKEAFEDFIASMETVSDAAQKGYTDAVYRYGENTVLAYAAKLSGFAATLTPEETVALRIYYRFAAGLDQPVPSAGIMETPSLMLYGGLILAHSDGKQYILDPILGEIACNATDYALAYCKDEAGRAIFSRDGGYYYYDETSGAMTATVQPASRWLYFDYTPDYGMDHHGLTPFFDEDSQKWGYRNAEGKIVIKAQYYRAFAFGENGIAVVQKNKLDGLLFINTAGKVVLDTHLQYYDYNGNLAYDWFRAPEELTGKSVGSLYFDHGYMRVTIQTYALSNSTEVLLSKQALVDVEGNTLSMPNDYTIVAYSDGVAVLEKDGKYGYYSYEGRWIADPIYESAAAFNGGIGVAKDKNGKYCAYDTEGNRIIPAVFDYLSAPSMGKILGYREATGWMLFSLYSKTEDTKEDITEE